MLIRTTITLLTTVASNANNRLVSSYSPLVRGYYVAIRCLFYMHLATERPPTGYHYFSIFLHSAKEEANSTTQAVPVLYIRAKTNLAHRLSKQKL